MTWGSGTHLPGTHSDTGPLRYCASCRRDQPQAGGVGTGQGWACARCWRASQFRLLGHTRIKQTRKTK